MHLKLNFLRDEKLNLDFWNLFLVLILFLFFIQHLYFSSYHFHECDSSNVYEWMKNVSIDSMGQHIKLVTPNFLINIRMKIAEITPSISFKPLQKFFQLPYISTYTPLMGLIYSQLNIHSFESFYQLGSLINGIVLEISSVALYLTCIKLNYSKPVSLISSTLLLTFYATNSYSYHLGSSIWFIFSICVGIYSLTFKNSFLKDLIYCLMLFLSYPFIVWIFSIAITRIIHLYIFNNANPKNLTDFLKEKVTKSFPLTTITFFFNLILFFPFGSGDRAGPDLRAFVTQYSFVPLKFGLNSFAIIFSIIIHCLLFFTLIKTIYQLKNEKVNFDNFCFKSNFINKDNFYSNRYFINIHCIIFLLIFNTLVVAFQLTLATTRHSLFIIPSVLILTVYGLEALHENLKSKNFFLLGRKKNPFVVSLISLALITSYYSSFERVDQLKQNTLPINIKNFISNNNQLEYTIMGCSPHYLYANLQEQPIKYNLENPLINNNLYQPGIKLLISQRPNDFRDEFSKYLYSKEITKGDTLEVKSKNAKITIISEPFIKKSNIYFDPINKRSTSLNISHTYRFLFTNIINLVAPKEIKRNIERDNINFKKEYNFYSLLTGEEYGYARPNDIWLVPIKVEKINT